MIQETLFDVRVWTSYNSTDEEDCRAQAIMESFDQDTLVQACKDTRGDSNITCAIEPHWSMGSRNLVLEARFSDGVRWVLKIYMLASDESCLTSSASSAPDQTSDGNEIYETLQREFEAMEFIRIQTKLPVPAPHFVIRLPSLLGPTACLAMDLVKGVNGAFLFDWQGNPNTQQRIRAAQQQVLKSMANIQITLAQFQAAVGGHLRKSPYSEYECFKVDNCGNRFPVDGFGVGGDSSYRTPLDFYNSKITKRARRLDTENMQYATSALKILNTIKENMSSCCINEPRFYLTNVDLGAGNAIFDTHGVLQAIIDVDTLRFVPVEYAVQVPLGLGLEFFSDRATSVGRADNWSSLLRMRQYVTFLFKSGVRCGQSNLGTYFSIQLENESAALIQGLEVIEGEDADWNNGWLGSESILKLIGQNRVTDSSISKPNPVAGAAKHSSKQSSVTLGANDFIHIQLSIGHSLQLPSDFTKMESPTTFYTGWNYQAVPEGSLKDLPTKARTHLNIGDCSPCTI